MAQQDHYKHQPEWWKYQQQSSAEKYNVKQG
jgi:hypothetical protein